MAPEPEEEEEELPGLEGLTSDPPAERILGPSGREYGSTSLFVLNVADFPRSLAIRVVESPVFDPLILLTILANCTTMAWESPLDPPGTSKAAFIDVCEWVYLWIFTFELLTKVVAYGFLMHDGAYLRDAWCQLDFIVVTLAWLPILFPSFGNYSVVRSVRALRPLRALKRMPGMPVLINSLLAALPKLGAVGILMGYLVLVMGVAGTEFFKGDLHYRCALPGYTETVGHPSLLEALEMSEEEERSRRHLSSITMGSSMSSSRAFGRRLRASGGGNAGGATTRIRGQPRTIPSSFATR